MRVAIQGEKGSFSHEAALALVPSVVNLQTCALSAEVFERVVNGSADAAVVPIENTLAGSVLEHYDLLLANPLRIVAERLVPIRHNLIAAPGVALEDIREVYSHPIALAQCRIFFANHPQIHASPYYDTAGSVAHAVRTGAPTAGIASDRAAREHGGNILLSGIEDHARNLTRFLLLRHQGAAPLDQSNAPSKVSLAFAVENVAGSLVRALEIFARHGLNLTRLESRPVPGTPWEYVFYADYQLDRKDSAAQALAELAVCCSFVKELGRYAAAPLVTDSFR